MTGKIIPYIAIGYIQATHHPARRALPLRRAVRRQRDRALRRRRCCSSRANLAVGITLSSLARNQLQAMQMTFFYFLPNILLSGFMFPFRGMPEWAQWIGSVLPLTYYKRLVRGILLKGNDWPDMWPSLWPLIVFAFVVMLIAVRFYRRTLD